MSLNGTPVRSLAHLGRLLDDADGPTEPPPDFRVVELGAHPPVIAALRRDEVAAALPKILATHGVPAARSVGPLPRVRTAPLRAAAAALREVAKSALYAPAFPASNPSWPAHVRHRRAQNHWLSSR